MNKTLTLPEEGKIIDDWEKEFDIFFLDLTTFKGIEKFFLNGEANGLISTDLNASDFKRGIRTLFIIKKLKETPSINIEFFSRLKGTYVEGSFGKSVLINHTIVNRNSFLNSIISSVKNSLINVFKER